MPCNNRNRRGTVSSHGISLGRYPQGAPADSQISVAENNSTEQPFTTHLDTAAPVNSDINQMDEMELTTESGYFNSTCCPPRFQDAYEEEFPIIERIAAEFQTNIRKHFELVIAGDLPTGKEDISQLGTPLHKTIQNVKEFSNQVRKKSYQLQEIAHRHAACFEKHFVDNTEFIRDFLNQLDKDLRGVDFVYINPRCTPTAITTIINVLEELANLVEEKLRRTGQTKAFEGIRDNVIELRKVTAILKMEYEKMHQLKSNCLGEHLYWCRRLQNDAKCFLEKEGTGQTDVHTSKCIELITEAIDMAENYKNYPNGHSYMKSGKSAFTDEQQIHEGYSKLLEVICAMEIKIDAAANIVQQGTVTKCLVEPFLIQFMRIVRGYEGSTLSQLSCLTNVDYDGRESWSKEKQSVVEEWENLISKITSVKTSTSLQPGRVVHVCFKNNPNQTSLSFARNKGAAVWEKLLSCCDPDVEVEFKKTQEPPFIPAEIKWPRLRPLSEGGSAAVNASSQEKKYTFEFSHTARNDGDGDGDDNSGDYHLDSEDEDLYESD